MMHRTVVPVKQLFDYIVTKDLPSVAGKSFISPSEDMAALEALLEKAIEVGEEHSVLEDEVFVNTWIPSTLDQMADQALLEKEIDRRQKGEEILYERLLAKKPQINEEEGDTSEGEEQAEGSDVGSHLDIPSENEDDVETKRVRAMLRGKLTRAERTRLLLQEAK